MRGHGTGVAWTLCSALALWAACSTGERPAPPQPPGAPVRPASDAPVPTAPPATAEPRKATLTRRDLETLVDAWLTAQNAGDFAAYERLYASEMRGVKRVGKREARMDRAQWMADRARMFRKPMVVEMRDVRLTPASGHARVDFVQVFRRGDFMDSGPKQLIVAMRNGAARIVREEMLESSVGLAASALTERVHVVFTHAGRGSVVLREKAEPGWGLGRFARHAPEDRLTVYAEHVDPAKVPDGDKWLGTSFRVHDTEGGSCTSTIDELELVLITDDQMLDEEDPELKRLMAIDRDDGRARFVMQHQAPVLVGRLAQCPGAFATPAAREEPVVYRSQPSDAALEKRIRETTRALPKYRTLRKEFEDAWRQALQGAPVPPEGPRPRQWAVEDGEVTVFASASGQRFASVSFVASTDGLDLGADLFALYRLDAEGKPSLVSVSPTVTRPAILVDVDGDGTPELYSADHLGTIHAVGSSGLYLLRYVPYLFDEC